jgi:hypothetical protein
MLVTSHTHFSRFLIAREAKSLKNTAEKSILIFRGKICPEWAASGDEIDISFFCKKTYFVCSVELLGTFSSENEDRGRWRGEGGSLLTLCMDFSLEHFWWFIST